MFSVLQNPVQDRVQLEFNPTLSSELGTTIKLHSINGRLLLEERITDNKDKFSFQIPSSIQTGVYLLSVYDSHQQHLSSRKIVVNK